MKPLLAYKEVKSIYELSISFNPMNEFRLLTKRRIHAIIFINLIVFINYRADYLVATL